MADQDIDRNIEIWKIKKLIKCLDSATSNGTSMISLIIPPTDDLFRVTDLLDEEHVATYNIKTRLPLLSAITSAQLRLILYDRIPSNGLVLYAGTIVNDNGEEKKLVTFDFEPFKPINTFLYICDNKFHTEALKKLIESDDDKKLGFMVMDANRTLFGTLCVGPLCGYTKEVLLNYVYSNRDNDVSKDAELATQFYLDPVTSQPNVSALILAPSTDFKLAELCQLKLFDPRLQAKILIVLGVLEGGENGFNQAIEMSAEILSNKKLIREKQVIEKYLGEISQDTGRYVIGVEDTIKALELGAIETLIVWEGLDIIRYVLKNSKTGEIVVKHLGKDQGTDQSNFHDSETNAELQVQEMMPLLELFVNEYKRFGYNLEFVTDITQQGSHFCKGLGGIGGILRYRVDIKKTFDELWDGKVCEERCEKLLIDSVWEMWHKMVSFIKGMI